MKHKMHLNEKDFERIKQGIKKIEGRVLDEKRKKLMVGDEIEFIQIDSGEISIKKIIALKRFNTFVDMFHGTEKSLWGNNNLNLDNFTNAFPYSKEEELKEGVIAIYLR